MENIELQNEIDLNNAEQILRKLNVRDFIRRGASLSKTDLALLKLHLAIVNIIIKDARKLKQKSPKRPLKDLIIELAQTWKENIQDLSFAVLEESK